MAVSGSAIFLSDIISHQEKESQNHNEIALQISSIIAGGSGVLALSGANAFSGSHDGDEVSWQDLLFMPNQRSAPPGFPMPHLCSSCHGKSGPGIESMSRDPVPY